VKHRMVNGSRRATFALPSRKSFLALAGLQGMSGDPSWLSTKTRFITIWL
jgi:hypothetical protein